MKREKNILAYFGHHKAGSTWILGLVRAVCSDIGIKHVHFHSPQMFDFDLGSFIEREEIDFISYTMADIDFVRPILPNLKGFHVVRDPRDVVISAYFSHLSSHSNQYWPELTFYREQLEKVPKDEGLLLTMKHLESLRVDGEVFDLFSLTDKWDYQLSNVMEVKFEELISNPYSKFIDILRFLGILDVSSIGLKADLKYLLKEVIKRLSHRTNIPLRIASGNGTICLWSALRIAYEHDFYKASGGRKPGEENVKHHYRKGIAGDWKNHFNEEHKRVFKQNYNPLLVKLCYETDDSW
jgi:hypothetical protein